MPYCYPQLSKWDLGAMRIGGPGLGNLLFVWARAYLLAREKGWPLIQPTWSQLKIGPIFRGEPDARGYQGLFQSLSGEVRGAHKLALLLMAPRIDAAELNNTGEGIELPPKNSLITVSGKGNLFDDLQGQDEILHLALSSMLRSPDAGIGSGADWLKSRSCELNCKETVAVHVRFGDFDPVNEAESSRGVTNRRQPQSWYVSAVEAMRKSVDSNLNFHVFSDAHDDELKELLALPGVRRMPAVSAAHDLLLMARYRALIASGSTFSMWASFLGQLPTVWYPGQRKFRLVRTENAECEFAPGQHLKSLCEVILRGKHVKP